VTTHFTARVRLTKQTPKAVTVPALGLMDARIIKAADIYRLYFHGPAYQVVERAWWDGHRTVGLLAKSLAANHLPSELPTFMAPRLIELCFQTAGIWEMGTQCRMGLPQHIDRVSSLLPSPPDSADIRLYAVVISVPGRGSFEAEVEKEGATTLPARRLFTIVRELPSSEIQMDIDGKNTAAIRSGNSFFKILGLPEEEFPPLPKFENAKVVTIRQKDLRDGLRKTSYAISTDETRYVLNGVLFSFKENKLTLVATDGREDLQSLARCSCRFGLEGNGPGPPDQRHSRLRRSALHHR
jgi:hypothetical protein